MSKTSRGGHRRRRLARDLKAYRIYEEFENGGVDPRPFLRPAIDRAIEAIEDRERGRSLGEALGRALEDERERFVRRLYPDAGDSES